MNIKITKEEHLRLDSFTNRKVTIGSRLYGTNSRDSDLDLLCVYRPPTSWNDDLGMFPNSHQFQYTEDNTDYIWTTMDQFSRNQTSGESTINSDVIMWNRSLFKKGSLLDESALAHVRTYKVIKAYLGFAKRDIRNWKHDKKLGHAARGLYCASCLLKNELPTLEGVRKQIELYNNNHKMVVRLKNRHDGLRKTMNDMYNKGELENYYIEDCDDPLLQQLLDSNNIREFRYA
jgi:predicted nucleotidyltransferase